MSLKDISYIYIFLMCIFLLREIKTSQLNGDMRPRESNGQDLWALKN